MPVETESEIGRQRQRDGRVSMGGCGYTITTCKNTHW